MFAPAQSVPHLFCADNRFREVRRQLAATGGDRRPAAGGEIDQAESARFRQDENRSESRNSGLRVEKRGLKRPGGPAFQDSGPPAWTFCCGSDRYCSGSHSQKPCIPTAFAGQGSWVTSASSHRCRPLLNPSVRVIGLRTSSVDDVMRLRAVTLASPHSGTATIAVLQRQCQRGHPRPGSSWSCAGDIDDFPFICREHGFAGGTECPDCSYEEFGEPRFQPQDRRYDLPF